MTEMTVRALRSEADYDWALGEIAPYFEAEPATGTEAADRFDLLTDLIEAYEARRWPIEPAEPIAAIIAVMETRGYTQADLARLLRSRSRASELLARRRKLTLGQMVRLNREWGVPADSLLRGALG